MTEPERPDAEEVVGSHGEHRAGPQPDGEWPMPDVPLPPAGPPSKVWPAQAEADGPRRARKREHPH